MIDLATTEQRAAERHRRLAASWAAAFGQRVIVALTSFVAMRFAFRALGAERYGVWATILSFTALLSFADLGLGNGLLNVLAPASATDDRDMARRAVSTAFWTLTPVAVLLELSLLVSAPYIPWPQLFNAHVDQTELAVTMIAFGTIFCVALPFGVAQRIYLAYQEAYAYSAWEAAGACASIALLIAAVAARGGLASFVVAAAISPLVAALGAGIALAVRRRPWLRPTLGDFSGSMARTLLRTGALFVVLQAAAAALFAADSLIAARALGAAEVPRYAVAARLFTYIGMLLGIVLTPLWPAFGEAMARGDRDWIRVTLRRAVMLSLLLSGAGSAVLVAGGRPLIRWWIGEGGVPPMSLLAGLAIGTILSGTFTAYAMFLNGINALGFQAAWASAMAIVATAAKIVLTGRFGVAALAWSTVIAYAVLSALPTAIYVRRVLANPADKMAVTDE